MARQIKLITPQICKSEPSGAGLQKKFASRSTLAEDGQIYSQSSPNQSSGRNGEVKSGSRRSQ